MKPAALYATLTVLLVGSGIALSFARFEAFTYEPEAAESDATPLEAEAPDAGREDASVGASVNVGPTGTQTGTQTGT